MNKKGFTLIELIGVIVLLSIVVSIATYSINRYLIQGREKSIEILANSMEDAVLEAYTSCLAKPNSSNFCTKHPMIENVGSHEKIYLKELENEYFIEKVKNPWKTSDRCSELSYVIVTRNDANNISFDYITCLKCGTHESEGCLIGNEYQDME